MTPDAATAAAGEAVRDDATEHIDDNTVDHLRRVIRRGSGLQRGLAAAIMFLSLALGTMLIMTAAFGAMTGYLQRIAFVFAILSIGLLSRSPVGTPWYRRGLPLLLLDLLIIAALFAGLVHVLSDYEAFARRIGFPLPVDLAFGIIYIAATLEVTRRFIGWPMIAIILLFLLQALFGEWFPAGFSAPNVRWQTLVEILFMQDQGVFGPTTAVAASYLMLFLVFGAILVTTNAVAFFQDFSLAVMGRQPGGPAHVAICSSALLGTASGSVVGNVAGTGSFTIQLMKRSGFRPEYAGAVEAVASSGAQIMPPIMGSAAFLMAGFLGINYWDIVIAALIPAALYFGALFAQVALRARRRALGSIEGELPRLLPVLASGGHFLLAIAALVAPFFYGYSPQRAALIGIVSLFLLSLLRPATRRPLGRYLEAVISAMAGNVPVGAAVAAAGVLMGTVWVSGAGNLLAEFVISASHGILPLALVLTAIIALVLGMGLPTPAVYLTVAVLIVPGLVQMGAPEIASHLFAFYFGILANVTPPVALAAYAAASIAGADLNRTGYQALKLALAGFIVPFIFIYNPGLLMDGAWWQITLAAITAALGVFLLAMAVEGWFRTTLSIVERIGLGVAALLLIWSDRLTEAAGAALAAGIIAYVVTRSRGAAALSRRTA
ncbi:hypothetical protein DLJ53_21615 [Acuticoccus sediminis]|uniref:TRAP C4-dicarboxylate transport system permease DctM subunit domain-containing protein n=1 Tax=Acuticoccus sediminis TaxID=2184697 RepID=A0A8B2NS95_9HYPH|nr:TRAP transporter fused permease subunit [Acuticoccus sediminis]RAH99149.1 hypothetical protein DLJ53_21615 [Acuticoccus sediminis]